MKIVIEGAYLYYNTIQQKHFIEKLFRCDSIKNWRVVSSDVFYGVTKGTSRSAILFKNTGNTSKYKFFFFCIEESSFFFLI